MAKPTNLASIKWRTILGLIFIYIAMWFNWQWAWGIVFLLWVIPDLITGVTYFMEPIEKKDHPILYWVIIISWLLMSLFSMASLFYPEWKYY